jgi:hypothetical protein
MRLLGAKTTKTLDAGKFDGGEEDGGGINEINME